MYEDLSAYFGEVKDLSFDEVGKKLEEKLDGIYSIGILKMLVL